MKAARERARTFLVYGFAVSVVAHLIVLPFVRPFPTVSAHEPDLVIRMPTPVPTPPPTPHPTQTPAATPRPTVPPVRALHTAQPREHHVKIILPRADAHAGGPSESSNPPSGGERGGPGEPASDAGTVSATVATPDAVAATPSPQPTPTPLSCARPDIPAATLRAAEPETPALAVQSGISGTVTVIVSLDAQSRIVATRIQSSPSAVLNPAAIAAARGSQFRTEIKDCAPVAADYIFSVDFSSQ